jgi:hypothetical protein
VEGCSPDLVELVGPLLQEGARRGPLAERVAPAEVRQVVPVVERWVAQLVDQQVA